MADRRWRVLRQDDNGNVFVASVPLSFLEARTLAMAFEARAHKQMYFVDELDAGEVALVGTRIAE